MAMTWRFGIYPMVSLWVFNTGWWFGTFFIFPNIGNVIIQTDFHVFSEVLKPPTSYGYLTVCDGKSRFLIGRDR
jgi:hypothetical protein